MCKEIEGLYDKIIHITCLSPLALLLVLCTRNTASNKFMIHDMVIIPYSNTCWLNGHEGTDLEFLCNQLT